MGRFQKFWKQITGADYRELKVLYENVTEELFNVRWIQCEDLKHQNEVLSTTAQKDIDLLKHSLITSLTAYAQFQAEKTGWTVLCDHLFELSQSLGRDPHLVAYMAAEKILNVNMSNYYATEDAVYHLLDCENYEKLLRYLEGAAFGTDHIYEIVGSPSHGQAEVITDWKIDKTTDTYLSYRSQLTQNTAIALISSLIRSADAQDIVEIEQSIYRAYTPVYTDNHSAEHTVQLEDEYDMEMDM